MTTNVMGKSAMDKKSTYSTGGILAVCLLLSVFLCYGQIRDSGLLLLACLSLFLLLAIWSNYSGAVLAVLLFFLPWSPLMKINYDGISFFTVALLAVCVISFMRDWRIINTYQMIAAIFLVILTIAEKIYQGNPVQTDYLAFLIMLLFFPCVIERKQRVSFQELTLFFAAGIISAALIARQVASLPNISRYIRVDSYLSITRSAGFYGDPNFYSAHITACLAGVLILLSKETRRLHQMAWIIIAVVLVYCGLLSASKSFILVAICLALAWIPTMVGQKTAISSKLRLTLWLICAACIVLSSTLFDSLLEVIRERFSYSANISQLTTGRTEIWKNYLKEFSQNVPLALFGNGYTSVTLDGRASHNTIIQCIYQFGLIGTVLYTAWLVLVLKRTHRKLGNGRLHWQYAVLLGIGVVMPWMALDILFFDEAFLLIAYAAIGTMTPGSAKRAPQGGGFQENAEREETVSKCAFLSPGERGTSAPTQSSN